MKLSARADYALRAAVELAVADSEPARREQLAEAQHIPLRFLGTILLDLKIAGLVRTQRGGTGGYRLARTLGDVAAGSLPPPVLDLTGEDDAWKPR